MEGSISSLWDGPLIDIPYDLLVGINHALMVISWHENLPKDEQPPRHIWWSDELLDSWFQDVRNNRESRHKKRSSYDDADDVPMMQNELAAQLRP